MKPILTQEHPVSPDGKKSPRMHAWPLYRRRRRCADEQGCVLYPDCPPPHDVWADRRRDLLLVLVAYLLGLLTALALPAAP